MRHTLLPAVMRAEQRLSIGMSEPDAGSDAAALRTFAEDKGGHFVVNEGAQGRSEEHTSELQSQSNLVCRLLLEKKKNTESEDASPSPRTTQAVNLRSTAVFATSVRARRLSGRPCRRDHARPCPVLYGRSVLHSQ